jgi:hypothetical protein
MPFFHFGHGVSGASGTAGAVSGPTFSRFGWLVSVAVGDTGIEKEVNVIAGDLRPKNQFRIPMLAALSLE